MDKKREAGSRKQLGSAETEKLKAELAEMEALTKRIQADFANYRRRSEEDRGLLVQAAKEAVVRQFLPVIDNFDRALGHSENVPGELRENDWVRGLLSVEQQLGTVLSRLGVERIATVGETFDADLHEAIGRSHDQAKHEGEITEEFESGWKIGARIIRPAKVRVNQKGAV